VLLPDLNYSGNSLIMEAEGRGRPHPVPHTEPRKARP
jgi:hypothetical protein